MPKITKKRLTKKNVVTGFVSHDVGLDAIFFSKERPERDDQGTYFAKDMTVIIERAPFFMPVRLKPDEVASIKVTVECIVYDKEGNLKK